ncbi:type I restriction-modification system subunit M [Pseudomonas sp. 32.2.56]|uniref:class I SAM-dependent DNA methyltransferase n=1 Tax=Pseudomonas sp. 32.2.56 TaxID=2969303 RepID=UPI00214FDAE7|nr:type I restriction-modification system subunit M [Pseudomonas sp. 32.2.56]MCR4508675.1 type I restriction-modification system subunit M [Pseudomonas sp. 32.2.56]
MAQLENIEAIEKRLWKAADTLRSNSELASNEYFLPVMGLIFLRHAYSRFLSVKDQIVASLPSRGGKVRELTKEDFSQKGAIYLNPKAEFDALVALTDADDRAEAIIKAMESIEKDYVNLAGQLPKNEYRSIPNDVLGQLLRTLNPDELKKATGDIFGRIYEYFLTEFADQGAHDGGEFFTPVSLVQLITNVLEPDHGIVFDPACGSGGMFVQSAHFLEVHKEDPNKLTFYGHEKNRVTTRLCKMNLAVHGLEGNVVGGEQAITYYNDPHENLWGNVDYVMANPPFNVDEVDAEKIKNDPRLPFGIPGINKTKKVPNANFLWIQYFYSYLNNSGRAGFVMSSQASSAGREDAKVREQLVKSGHVDAMIDIRGNFFYTRTVPCQLWFLNKDKPKEHQDKVLMIDARNVYRKVTRKIYDFSPEQLKNLTSIVWLYRGETDRFIELVQSYIDSALLEAQACEKSDKLLAEPMPDFIASLKQLYAAMHPFLKQLEKEVGPEQLHVTLHSELLTAIEQVTADWSSFQVLKNDLHEWWGRHPYDTADDLLDFTESDICLKDLAESSRDLVKLIDHAYKLSVRLIELCESEHGARDNELWDYSSIHGTRRASLKKLTDSARKVAVEQLKQVRYFYKQAHWLLSRFPEGKLCNVDGLVKLVSIQDIEDAAWSLTPARYVGFSPEEIDEDFDFEETLREIHIELKGLNDEAVRLADDIAKNFEGLGI